MNVEQYPEFLPYARQIADDYLARARSLMLAPDLQTPEYRPLEYSEEGLQTRLMEIYKTLQQTFELAYDPAVDANYPHLESVHYRIRQLAPFNQLDGAWLRNTIEAGPIDDVKSCLFSIWRDELGNGRPELNHANIYGDLLHSVGIYLPDVHSREYAEDPAFLDQAFIIPVFVLAVSQFPRDYFPELLGMTLNLEWEVLGLQGRQAAALFRHRSVLLHDAHRDRQRGERSRQARPRRREALPQRRLPGEGNEAMHAAWRRIWNGYVAFATTGNLASLINRYGQSRPRVAQPSTYKDAVLALVQVKGIFGQYNHGTKRLGVNLINDLFEDPEGLLDALVESMMVLPGDPDNSPLFEKLAPTGPMFNVFSADEITLLRNWVRSIGKKNAPTIKPDFTALIVKAMRYLKSLQLGQAMHAVVKLGGRDAAGEAVTASVAQWLDGDPVAFLRALRDPENQMIVPGDVASSPFLERLSLDTPMGRAWNAIAPHSGEITWREVASGWIREGCRLPGDTDDALAALAAKASTFSRPHVILRPKYRDARPYGMGIVH